MVIVVMSCLRWRRRSGSASLLLTRAEARWRRGMTSHGKWPNRRRRSSGASGVSLEMTALS